MQLTLSVKYAGAEEPFITNVKGRKYPGCHGRKSPDVENGLLSNATGLNQ